MWIRAASHLAFVLCTAKPIIGAGLALSLGAGLAVENAFGRPIWQPAGTSALLGLLGASTMTLQSNPLTRSFAWLLMLASSAFSNRAFRESGVDSQPVEALLLPVLFWHLACLWRARREGHRPKVFVTALSIGILSTLVSWLPYYAIPRSWWAGWSAVAGPMIYFGIVSAGLYAVIRLHRFRVFALYTLAALILAGLYLGVPHETERPDSRYAIHGSRPSVANLRDVSLRQRRDREHPRPAGRSEATSRKVQEEPKNMGESALLQVC